jgi:hypothetical protein
MLLFPAEFRVFSSETEVCAEHLRFDGFPKPHRGSCRFQMTLAVYSEVRGQAFFQFFEPNTPWGFSLV